MTQNYRVLTPQDINDDGRHAFSLDVLVGLSETPKKLPSRYFYDRRGSLLFEQIMDLPEYYLTRCELEILNNYGADLARAIQGESFNLIELGAGNGRKTSVLVDHFLGEGLDFQYLPIDISEDAMAALNKTIGERFPDLVSTGVVSEYFSGLRWLRTITRRRNVVLFLGSNVGNFNRVQARVFLRNLWNTLNDGDYVIIGFDLKKDIDLMLQAYNDPEGVTSQFNLNLLYRINNELGGNFDLKKFRHYSSYDVFSGAVESYLVSLESQQVFIRDISQTFSFEAWEPIHTEYSYKYLDTDIENLAKETGYLIDRQLYDEQRHFVDSVWRVLKDISGPGTE